MSTSKVLTALAANQAATALDKTAQQAVEHGIQTFPGYLELMSGEFNTALRLLTEHLKQNSLDPSIDTAHSVARLKAAPLAKYAEESHFMERMAQERLQSLRNQSYLSQSQRDLANFNLATSYYQKKNPTIGNVLYNKLLLERGSQLDSRIQQAIASNRNATGDAYQYLLMDYTAI